MGYNEIMKLSALTNPEYLLQTIRMLQEFIKNIPQKDITEFEFRQSIHSLPKDVNIKLDGGNC
jgi:hypothetical protein